MITFDARTWQNNLLFENKSNKKNFFLNIKQLVFLLNIAAITILHFLLHCNWKMENKGKSNYWIGTQIQLSEKVYKNKSYIILNILRGVALRNWFGMMYKQIKHNVF